MKFSLIATTIIAICVLSGLFIYFIEKEINTQDNYNILIYSPDYRLCDTHIFNINNETKECLDYTIKCLNNSSKVYITLMSSSKCKYISCNWINIQLQKKMYYVSYSFINTANHIEILNITKFISFDIGSIFLAQIVNFYTISEVNGFIIESLNTTAY